MKFVGNTMIDTLVALEDRIRERGAARVARRRAGELPAGHAAPAGARRRAAARPTTMERRSDGRRASCRLSSRSIRARARCSTAPTYPGVTLTDPVGYLDFLSLEADAAAVLTDSGGIQEETTYLGIPCFTLRDNTERPVTIRAGTNTLLGLDPERIAEIPALLRAARRAQSRTGDSGTPRSVGRPGGRAGRRCRRGLVASERCALPSLVPRDRVFFDLFNQAGQNTLRAARMLQEMLHNWPDDSGLAREILLAEQEGDRITHDIVQRINTTFVTPIDGEDIYALATKLDDIVDFIEETADFMGLYQIEAPMEQAQAMADVLVEVCEQLAAALAASARLRGARAVLDRDPPARERRRPPLPRRGRGAVRQRHRPDGRDPLEGHLHRARAGDRRHRDRRPHPRGHRRSRTS